jgi:outer membrane protein W
MTERIYRIVFLLFIVAGSIRLSAQAPSSDVGLWLVGSQLKSSTLSDPDGDVNVDFNDEKGGYGVSFNHFWTDTFSTELAAQKFGADMTLSSDLGGGVVSFNAGHIDITSITAMGQWHFRRAARFQPYLGAGVARISGQFNPVDDPEDPANSAAGDLESKITWTAAAGANIRITERIFIVTEFKYIPWSAIAKDDPTSDSLDLDPTTLSAGVKVRF